VTYTAVAMNWGIIGGLTGWGSQLPLTYDPAVRVRKGGMHMPAGIPGSSGLTITWDFNYGATAVAINLVAGVTILRQR
jgi:hypothetical protein